MSLVLFDNFELGLKGVVGIKSDTFFVLMLKLMYLKFPDLY